MDLAYSDNRMRKVFTDARYATRQHGADIARALATRVGQLQSVDALSELVGTAQPGRWEELSADRAGQVSCRVTPNYRLIVTVPEGEVLLDSGTAVLVAIVDYH